AVHGADDGAVQHLPENKLRHAQAADKGPSASLATQAADKGPSASLASLRHPSTYRKYASGGRSARRLASRPFSPTWASPRHTRGFCEAAPIRQLGLMCCTSRAPPFLRRTTSKLNTASPFSSKRIFQRPS